MTDTLSMLQELIEKAPDVCRYDAYENKYVLRGRNVTDVERFGVWRIHRGEIVMGMLDFCRDVNVRYTITDTPYAYDEPSKQRGSVEVVLTTMVTSLSGKRTIMASAMRDDPADALLAAFLELLHEMDVWRTEQEYLRVRYGASI